MIRSSKNGSTQVVERKKPKEKEKNNNITYFTLRLPKKVTWTEDTVDNENMRHKKSNICCIYHKPKLSPDDSDTSSCESCDEKGKNAYERPNHYDRKNNNQIK